LKFGQVAYFASGQNVKSDSYKLNMIIST